MKIFQERHGDGLKFVAVWVFLLSLPVSQSLASVVGATVSALVSEFNPLQ